MIMKRMGERSKMIVKMLMIINEVWLGRKGGVTRGGVVYRRRGVCRRIRGVGGR